MTKKTQIQELAESMFVEQGMNAKTIAETLGKREGTISGWRKKYLWDDLKRENLSAPHKIRKLLLQEMEKISTGEKSNVDADALAKVSKVMETLSTRTSPQVIITVIKALDHFLAKENPQLAVESLGLHKKFIQNAIANNGI